MSTIVIIPAGTSLELITRAGRQLSGPEREPPITIAMPTSAQQIARRNDPRQGALVEVQLLQGPHVGETALVLADMVTHLPPVPR